MNNAIYQPGVHPISSARVAHAALGAPEDRDAYIADTVVIDRLNAINFPIETNTRATRAFQLRAVTYAVQTLGMHQVLDIGPGLPPHIMADTHSIASLYHHDRARVLYADVDPVVTTHWNMWVTGTSIRARTLDLRSPELLDEARAHFDFRHPVAVVMTAVLDNIRPGDYPHKHVQQLISALPAGSVLALSHLTQDYDPPHVHRAAGILRDAGLPTFPRTFEEIAQFFDGLLAIGPGLVPISQWLPSHADGEAPVVHAYGGVGRK
ncbi:SAM-dependent methyltransferase [Streptomyces qinzhouensis]|uniref:SAM-dependent methyltransferase n=1 Tax=Streptomyces qinzhouensis TaxID=2599401 RepID=UPI001644EABA|nr:SAM-dependent methyltransferase [Streptomyces qinzhouensis]